MSENLVSVTECAKIFGVNTRTVECYVWSEVSPFAEGEDLLVNTASFYRWVLDKESCTHTLTDLEECRRNALTAECQKLEIAIASNKALQNPNMAMDDDCILYLRKLRSAFGEDIALVSGGDDEIVDEIISRFRFVLNACAEYLSNYMTEQGRFRLRRILRGKT